MSVLEDLKAAVARDAEMDAKLVEYVTVLRGSIADLSAKLDAAVTPTGVDETAVKAVVDELNAHVDDMAKVLPAAPAPELVPEPAPVVDVAPDTPPDAPLIE